MPTPNEQFAFYLRRMQPADLGRCHFMILDEPLESTIDKATYFEANALIYFEVEGQKYGVKQRIRVSQLVNFNSCFQNASGAVLKGSDIYNTNLPKILNSLNMSLEQIHLVRPLNISETEFIILKKKKALLMFLKGQLVEISDIKVVETKFGKKRETHWRLANLQDLKPTWNDRQFSEEHEKYFEYGA